MESFVENKSKKLAFTFTVGIHLLLFLFLLFTGFIIPKNETVAKAEGNGGLSMSGYDLIALDGMLPTSKSASPPKLLSDPNEKDFKMEKTHTAINTINTGVVADSEYETILKKWTGRKKLLENGRNLGGTDLEGMNKGHKEGNSISIETDGTFILTNRSLLQNPEVILNSTDEGKVVVDIIVNESGKVISAIAGQRGSTTTSKALYEKAVNAAYTAKFNPSEEGIKEQRGTYTFVFTLE